MQSESQGVKRLDAVVATHADRDHIGGLPYIVDHFRVGEVLLSCGAEDDRERPLLEACTRRGVPVHRLKRGDTVDLEDGRLEVLHPPDPWPAEKNDNNRSLVLRLTWSGPTMLFPGDAQAEAEKELVENECPASVLKAPHHGSNTSSTPAFIDAVSPADCIVSTGNSRSREVADPEIDRYLDFGKLDRYRR